MNYKSIKFNLFKDNDPYGLLNIFDMNKVPFNVKRIFTVTSNSNLERGYHAHKKCQQLVSCLKGKINLILDDGNERELITLFPDGKAILIPNGVWAEQIYIEDASIIITFCDQSYDEDDYIRNYKEYKDFLNK